MKVASRRHSHMAIPWSPHSIASNSSSSADNVFSLGAAEGGLVSPACTCMRHTAPACRPLHDLPAWPVVCNRVLFTESCCTISLQTTYPFTCCSQGCTYVEHCMCTTHAGSSIPWQSLQKRCSCFAWCTRLSGWTTTNSHTVGFNIKSTSARLARYDWTFRICLKVMRSSTHFLCCWGACCVPLASCNCACVL